MVNYSQLILGSYYNIHDMVERDNWFQSNIGEDYKARWVFAFSIIEQFHLLKVWKPQQWNSLCLVHQTNHYSLHLNNNDILRQVNKNNDNNTISLTYDLLFGPIFGAIADLQIWKRSLTNQEITDFKECTLKSGGDFYQWDPTDFTLKDNIVIEELAAEEYCQRPPKKTIIPNGKLSQFYETIEFCKDVFKGRMAVSKDLDSLRAMSKAVNASSCTVKSYFYTGHIYDGNGRFLDFYDKQPLNFRNVEIN